MGQIIGFIGRRGHPVVCMQNDLCMFMSPPDILFFINVPEAVTDISQIFVLENKDNSHIHILEKLNSL